MRLLHQMVLVDQRQWSRLRLQSHPQPLLRALLRAPGHSFHLELKSRMAAPCRSPPLIRQSYALRLYFGFLLTYTLVSHVLSASRELIEILRNLLLKRNLVNPQVDLRQIENTICLKKITLGLPLLYPVIIFRKRVRGMLMAMILGRL